MSTLVLFAVSCVAITVACAVLVFIGDALEAFHHRQFRIRNTEEE